jgi:hypothetical protein
MTNASREMMIRVLAFGMLIVAATSGAQQRPPIVEQMAKTYGIDSWSQVDAIRYTFNLDIPGRKVSRSWTWEPKADRVTFEGKDKGGKPVKVTYVRSQISSQPENVKKDIDPGFVNDQYWLLFPFHVVWDTGANVENKGKQKLPMGKGSAEHVVVKYPSDVGYTPGDTWELYVGADSRVEEFVFRHGGSAKPGVVIATWTGYKKAGPLLISTEHRGTADGKPMRLTFTNVAVKVTGSDKWVDAQ